MLNKIINWLSSGELESLRYKVEIYSKKIDELMLATEKLMEVNENNCKERERLFHKRIAEQSRIINFQSTEIGRLKHFEMIVLRQRAAKKAWKERNKK